MTCLDCGATIGDLFAGYGGLALACQQAFGARVAWHSEIEPGPAKLLEAHWPGIPNHGDITRIDWTQVEPVDILAGGFPCTDVSLAGRRAGLGATRSGLWSPMLAAIEALHPRWVVIENVRGLLSTEAQRSTDATNRDMEPGTATLGDRSTGPVLRAAGAVLGDLAAVGYDARWTTLRASAIGAPHHRERVFILAYPADTDHSTVNGERTCAEPWRRGASATDTDGVGCGQGARQSGTGEPEEPATVGGHTALLPTPVAQPSGNTPEDHLRKKPGRKVVTDLAILVENDLLTTGGVVLPTPTVGNATGTNERRGGARGNEMLLPGVAVAAATGALLPGVPAQPIQEPVNWGRYEAAIRRWEAVLGRAAPDPTEPNRNGRPQLNPEFASWMMGLPKGWVTGHGLTRTEQLKAIGNGVVPRQAMAALAILLGVR